MEVCLWNAPNYTSTCKLGHSALRRCLNTSARAEALRSLCSTICVANPSCNASCAYFHKT